MYPYLFAICSPTLDASATGMAVIGSIAGFPFAAEAYLKMAA